jgi:hypothetical protein
MINPAHPAIARAKAAEIAVAAARPRHAAPERDDSRTPSRRSPLRAWRLRRPAAQAG